MKVKKATAATLLAAVGVENADRMSVPQLIGRLNKIDQYADGDTLLDDERLQKVLTAALTAVANVLLVEVEEDDAKASKTKTGDKMAKKRVSKSKSSNDAVPTTKPAPPKTKTPGVRPTRGRPYCAGIIIRKHGLKAGVTDEMLAEMTAACGENDVENLFTLRNSWHTARGMLTKDNEADLAPPVEA